MAILTKAEILKGVLYNRIRITPWTEEVSMQQIGPNSIDLTLGNSISFYPFVKLEDSGELSGGGDTITIGQTSVDTRPPWRACRASSRKNTGTMPSLSLVCCVTVCL